jgi:hypothetical protein
LQLWLDFWTQLKVVKQGNHPSTQRAFQHCFGGEVMTKYPTLTIRIPQETLHWLKIEAELQDTSNAQIVKQALDLYYRTQHPTD